MELQTTDWNLYDFFGSGSGFSFQKYQISILVSGSVNTDWLFILFCYYQLSTA